MIPIHYIGWTIILLAILRLFNKATLELRWKLAFSTFTVMYSLGKLACVYNTQAADFLYLLSAATILIPFLKIDYKKHTNIEKISEASLLFSIGIIVLLS